jgi:hypothetical protein
LMIVVETIQPELPIVCVRPSIIGPSMDGTRGSLRSPGCQFPYVYARTPFGRFLPWWGSGDIVFVDQVATHIVQALTEGNKRGVLHCTSGLAVSAPVLLSYCFPGRKLCILLSPTGTSRAQRLEVWVARRMGRGDKMRAYYDAYTYFAGNTWDFPLICANSLEHLKHALVTYINSPSELKSVVS